MKNCLGNVIKRLLNSEFTIKKMFLNGCLNRALCKIMDVTYFCSLWSAIVSDVGYIVSFRWNPQQQSWDRKGFALTIYLLLIS